jgi:hypothetical protein
MARLIPMMDDKRRDAHVAAEWPRRAAPLRMAGAGGAQVKLERLIRSTDAGAYEALLRAHRSDEEIARALAAADPEIDLRLVGRKLGDAARVYMRKDGSVLAIARVMRVTRGPDGSEKSREEFGDVEATVREDGAPIVWTGRLVPIEEAVRKFAFVRQLQLRHVSGLTFDFLHATAKTLHDARKMALVGTGPKGQGPLVFTTNGAPYRGFLEGRVEGESYRLVLHLSNLEIKSVGAGGEA